MNPEIKARWLEALRSGEYTQGISMLKKQASPDGKIAHCCLGVLCEIAAKEQVCKEIKLTKNNCTSYYFKGSHPESTEQEAYPPVDVLEWSALERDSAKCLAQLNDRWESFDDIAAVIERDL